MTAVIRYLQSSAFEVTEPNGPDPDEPPAKWPPGRRGCPFSRMHVGALVARPGGVSPSRCSTSSLR
jgi:hypothetical protein